MSKKKNKSKQVNSISSTKKMNENNIKDVKAALEDDAKKQDIEAVIQKNIESKIEDVKESEESIIVEQEEADSSELVEENFYKSEVLEKIKTELKDKKKKNSKSRKRKLIFINFIVGALVEMFVFGCLATMMWVPEEYRIIVHIIRSTLAIIGAITLLELGYVKKKTLYFIYGVETFVAATLDLLVINVFKNSGIEDVYNLFIIIAGSVAIYYIIRAFVINITYKNVDDTEKK